MSQLNPTIIQAMVYAKAFIETDSQIKAFIAAFPKSTASPRNISNKASKVHKTAQIQTAIKTLQSAAKTQLEEEYKVSCNDIQKTLARVIEAGITKKIDPQGNEIPVALGAVVSAAAELNKMNGYLAAVKQDHTSSDGTMTPRNFNDFYSDKA